MKERIIDKKTKIALMILISAVVIATVSYTMFYRSYQETKENKLEEARFWMDIIPGLEEEVLTQKDPDIKYEMLCIEIEKDSIRCIIHIRYDESDEGDIRSIVDSLKYADWYSVSQDTYDFFGDGYTTKIEISFRYDIDTTKL